MLIPAPSGCLERTYTGVVADSDVLEVKEDHGAAVVADSDVHGVEEDHGTGVVADSDVLGLI